MEKLTRSDITKSVAERLNVTNKEADEIICATLDFIAENLAAGNRISLKNFGSFELHARAGRTGTNPKTKEPIEIPASIAPVFKPAKALKDAVNAGPSD